MPATYLNNYDILDVMNSVSYVIVRRIFQLLQNDKIGFQISERTSVSLFFQTILLMTIIKNYFLDQYR